MLAHGGTICPLEIFGLLAALGSVGGLSGAVIVLRSRLRPKG